ncbi:MAG: type IV toxin-antitoxin system AbiEi family antitoxin domain-containing protein [Pseudonocardiaceae bacterium]
METLLSMPGTVADLPPTFTTRTTHAFGLHPRELYRMRDEGELFELSRAYFGRQMPQRRACLMCSRLPIELRSLLCAASPRWLCTI